MIVRYYAFGTLSPPAATAMKMFQISRISHKVLKNPTPTAPCATPRINNPRDASKK